MRKRPLILIVDNDAGARALLSRHLRPRYDLLTLSRGETLLPLVRRREPDAVIMDVNMPGRDGFRLGRLVHRENRLRPIPILFLSTGPDEDEFFATMDTTVAGFLRKPLDLEQLDVDLRQLLMFWGGALRIPELQMRPTAQEIAHV